MPPIIYYKKKIFFCKEYKEIAERSVKPMLLWLKHEFSKCEIGLSGIVEKCDFQDILQKIENCKMPRDHVGREFHDFVRVREFDVKFLWKIFQGEIGTFDELPEEIKPALEKFENLPRDTNNSVMQMVKGKLSLKGQKEKDPEIIEKKPTMEQKKRSVLEYLDKLIKKMDAIAWEKLLEWDEPIDRKQAPHYFGHFGQ
jgi:hypothetical protein